MLHFGSVPCPVLTLTLCVFFFVILKANGQISAWQSVNFHGSAFSACATPAVMHLISTPATHPLQLTYRSFTPPHSLPSVCPCVSCWISLSLIFSHYVLTRRVSGVFIWPGFWPAFFSLWRLCLPASRLPGWEKETIELFLLWSQSVLGSGSTPYLLQIKSLPNARHLCQGKPSPPSFKVNMHLRQGLQLLPWFLCFSECGVQQLSH